VFGGGSLWLLPSGLLGFVLLFTCALAENNRLPFDMAECESELVGGYHTEYSSMGFGVYMFAEYVAMTLSAALVVTLFLGGWHFPFLTDPDDHSWLAGADLGRCVPRQTRRDHVDVHLDPVDVAAVPLRPDHVARLAAAPALALGNIGAVAIVGIFVQG
jgi:hypothetical protein